MKRLLFVFMLMLTYVTHAQENQDIEETAIRSNNTLEVTGFSVLVEEASDSLSIANDSLAVKEEKKINSRDSLLFLSFWLPKPGVLKNVVVDNLPKIPDSVAKNITPQFKIHERYCIESRQ